MTLRTAVSIHDVMPATLRRCEALFALCQLNQIAPVTLLVVPGLNWSDADLARLHALQEAGAQLAGHGWQHRIDTRQLRGVGPRLHSMLMSKDVAEHLLLDAAGIAALINRCYVWFERHGLPSPALYVPPAWVMGRISNAALADLPFCQFETFAGVYLRDEKRFVASPVVGFEATSAWRVVSVGAWNCLSRLRALHAGHWRISLHPDDLSLGLSQQLGRFLREVTTPVGYDALCERGASPHAV